MQEEYDFSNAKRANTIPHLNRLREQLSSQIDRPVINGDLLKAFKDRFGEDYVTVINDVLKDALDNT